ncbi:MAG: asparagine synthase C-terminal domain-containing protein [Candidatus Poseidoniales archaeon]
MTLSSFSQDISKVGWDRHIDVLINNHRIVPTKKNIYLSLKKKISEKTEGVNFGVLLSGGVDSSIIAKICKDLGREFRCFCVGIKGSKDIFYARKVSDYFNLDLVVKEYTLDELELLLKEVIDVLPIPVIEEDNYIEYIVKLTVSAVNLGSMRLGSEELFFTGIGAEELFAGYERHSKAIKGGGTWRGIRIGDLKQEGISGLKRMYNLVFERDKLISSYISKSLLAPYLADEVIIQAMNMRDSQKIDSLSNKKILRNIALDLGIPKEFSDRKKKGAQYGSGFDKAILKLAKLNGFKLKKRYIESLMS